MAQPLINGVRHSWASIKLMMLGREVTGITEVSYKDSNKKDNHYGAGTNPTHRGRGQYAAEASIKLDKYEVEAIQAAIPGQRIQEIDMFDIVVSYIPEGSDVLKTDVIRNCEFLENSRDVKSGDTTIGVPLPLIVSHIDWNGLSS